MDIPIYVTVEEVRRICKALNIRDWTLLSESEVFPEEARAILAAIDPGGLQIDFESFRRGLEVELEHGTRYPKCKHYEQSPDSDWQNCHCASRGDYGLL